MPSSYTALLATNPLSGQRGHHYWAPSHTDITQHVPTTHTQTNQHLVQDGYPHHTYHGRTTHSTLQCAPSARCMVSMRSHRAHHTMASLAHHKPPSHQICGPPNHQHPHVACSLVPLESNPFHNSTQDVIGVSGGCGRICRRPCVVGCIGSSGKVSSAKSMSGRGPGYGAKAGCVCVLYGNDSRGHHHSVGEEAFCPRMGDLAARGSKWGKAYPNAHCVLCVHT